MTNSANVSDISCREAVELIAMLLDRSAGDIERAVLETHLKKCRHCFDRLEFEKLLKGRLAAVKAAFPSEQMERRIHEILAAF